jgi:predicted transcriptional regulator
MVRIGEPHDPNSEYVQCNARIRKEQDLQLADIAWYQDSSKSAIIREALEDWFAKQAQRGRSGTSQQGAA